MDAEIADLCQRIVSLSSERIDNNLVPISSIPSEILISVLLEVRDDGSNLINRTRSKTTLILSSVCRLWSDVILDCPQMWSAIDSLHPEAVRTFLERSKQAPLSIDFFQCDPHHRICIEQVLAQLPRIHDLFVECHSPFELVGWNNPAPALTILNIRSVKLPVDAFSGSLPSLRNLQLNTSSTPTLPISSGLQELTITLPRLSIPLNELALVLNQFPDLSRLCLDHMLQKPTEVALPIPQITLPNLTALTLNDFDFFSVTQLINALQTPPTARISVFTSVAELGATDQLLQAFRTCSQFSRDITTLRINKDLWVTHLQFRMASLDPHDIDSLEYYALLKVYCGDVLLPAATSRVFDLSNLVELVVSDKSDHIITPWRELFEDIPNLRILKVSGLAAYSFVRHIGMEGETLGAHGDGVQADNIQESQVDRLGFDYQNLRELEMVFHDGDTSQFEDQLVAEGSFVVDLVLRAKHGIGLSNFTCSGWPMAASSVEQITTVVPNIHLMVEMQRYDTGTMVLEHV